MFKGIVLVVSLFVCGISTARTIFSNDSGEPIRFAPKMGYSWQQSSYIEGGLLIYKDIGPEGFFLLRGGFAGVYIGAEIHPEEGNRIGGFRMGIESHYALFGARTGCASLDNFNGGHSLQYSFEAGLSCFGWIYLMAGYNWTLSNPQYVNISGFKISAGINFNFWHQLVDE